MQNVKVFSYLRFSHIKQAAGHSVDRQIEYANKWAAENGMQLDESLSMRDEGLSAYHQRHVKQGALGVFLRAVEEGRVEPGSVLIVEGLDRLSRAEPIQAQAQLAQIVNAGISVVTASDGRVYNREKLRAQPMDLVYSLLVMIRAHEESDTKSKRVTAALRRVCEGWTSGTYRGLIRSGTDPQWVRQAGNRFELEPDRAKAVRFLIDRYLAGYGNISTMRELAARGMSISKAGNNAPQAYRILKTRALLGEKSISVGGQDYRMEGYYPVMVTEAEYAKIQTSLKTGGAHIGKSEIPGIITGMAITRCGYCGHTVTAQNLMHRRRKDGTFSFGHRRLMCMGYSKDAGCRVGGSFSIVPIEGAIMRYCSDQMNLSSLLRGDSGIDGINASIALDRARLSEVEQKLEKIADAMLASDTPPAVFVKKASELEDQAKVIKAGIDDSHRALAAAAAGSPEGADAWSAIIEDAMALDYDARAKARQLVGDTFKKITVHLRGITGDGDAIEIVLISKTGTTRLLKVDRQTGAWRAMEDYAIAA